jgi:hypothetical protein
LLFFEAVTFKISNTEDVVFSSRSSNQALESALKGLKSVVFLLVDLSAPGEPAEEHADPADEAFDPTDAADSCRARLTSPASSGEAGGVAVVDEFWAARW